MPWTDDKTRTPGLSFELQYFGARKLGFANLDVAFPGGFGALDELCEILTLPQMKYLARPIPVLLHGKSYWQDDALAKSLGPCCEPDKPCARHGTADFHEPSSPEGRDR